MAYGFEHIKTDIDNAHGCRRGVYFTSNSSLPPNPKSETICSLSEMETSLNTVKQRIDAKKAMIPFIKERGLRMNHNLDLRIEDSEKNAIYLDKFFAQIPTEDYKPKHFPYWDNTQYYTDKNDSSFHMAKARLSKIKETL